LSLSRKDVQHVATLARLKLTEDEELLYQKQLSAILEAVDQLKAVDTSNIVATSHANVVDSPLRADEVKPSLPSEKSLRNAPAKSDTSFAVPKIIE
jgi:aspartyl-tRNA(Asn)/glutamyl-tRNA(Gln) amidotransferase subunit C